jgi:hypothetical protein
MFLTILDSFPVLEGPEYAERRRLAAELNACVDAAEPYSEQLRGVFIRINAMHEHEHLLRSGFCFSALARRVESMDNVLYAELLRNMAHVFRRHNHGNAEASCATCFEVRGSKIWAVTVSLYTLFLAAGDDFKLLIKTLFWLDSRIFTNVDWVLIAYSELCQFRRSLKLFVQFQVTFIACALAQGCRVCDFHIDNAARITRLVMSYRASVEKTMAYNLVAADSNQLVEAELLKDNRSCATGLFAVLLLRGASCVEPVIQAERALFRWPIPSKAEWRRLKVPIEQQHTTKHKRVAVFWECVRQLRHNKYILIELACVAFLCKEPPLPQHVHSGFALNDLYNRSVNPFYRNTAFVIPLTDSDRAHRKHVANEKRRQRRILTEQRYEDERRRRARRYAAGFVPQMQENGRGRPGRVVWVRSELSSVDSNPD